MFNTSAADCWTTGAAGDLLCFTEGLEDLTVEVAGRKQQVLVTVSAGERWRQGVCALQQVLQQGELYQLQQSKHRLLPPHLIHNCENRGNKRGQEVHTYSDTWGETYATPPIQEETTYAPGRGRG